MDKSMPDKMPVEYSSGFVSPRLRRNQTLVAVESAYYGDWQGSAMSVIVEEAQRRGWQIVDTRFFSKTRRDGSVIHYYESVLPEAISPAGALIQSLPGSELVLELASRGCKMVRIGKAPNPEDASLPAVIPDMAAAGRMAAQHFAARGFRHVGFVGHDPWSLHKELHSSFDEAAKELALTSHLLQFRSNDTDAERKNRPRRFVDWLRNIPAPVGLLAHNDKAAAGFSAWAIVAGIEVPAKMAVLGYGNAVSLCECNVPRISSIDPNRENEFRAACDLLHEMMEGAKPPRKPLMIPPAGICVRTSTDVLATSDPDVGAALRYMWNHLDLDLSVSQIVREVGATRRGLERAFQHELGRSIIAELRRKRLETFVELLKTTSLPIHEICKDTGFFTRDYLHRIFKKEFGMTPLKYRKQFGRDASIPTAQAGK